MPDNGFGPFKSFIAVPLVAKKDSHRDANVLGVLCIHFKGTGTLDRLGVKLASLVANIVADEYLAIRETRSTIRTLDKS
jgi:hypothetical protein